MNTDALRLLGACEDAVVWAAQQPSARTAWAECKRADWMLWLVWWLSGRVGSASRKRLVLCACACARTALRYVPAGEDRPRVAIETAERYCRGEATLEDVRTATAAAYAAAYAAADASALERMADIVREHYPQPPRLRIFWRTVAWTT